MLSAMVKLSRKKDQAVREKISLSLSLCLSQSNSESSPSSLTQEGLGHLIYWYPGSPEWCRTLRCSHAPLYQQLGHDCVLCCGQNVACPYLVSYSPVRPWLAMEVTRHAWYSCSHVHSWSATCVTGHLVPAPHCTPRSRDRRDVTAALTSVRHRVPHLYNPAWICRIPFPE